MAAPRATWKGHLRLSLVSCPVRLYTATTESTRLSFHLLHKDTHNRIRMQPKDPEIGDVDRADLVKGYEYDKDRYVVLTDQDFDQVRIESTDTLVIDSFADETDVDELYLDRPYYLAPDGKVAQETFRVIHQAMQDKGKVAISRLVIGGRERLMILYPRDKGFVVTTLRTDAEVRDASLYFGDIAEGPVDADMLALASQLIDQKAGSFDPATFHDHYEDALREMVEAKLKGEAPVIAKAPERGKVINLMDALRQSLQRTDGSDGRAPAEAEKEADAEDKAEDATKPPRQKKSA
ncbi:MAG: Ku protein [Rhodospirillales bacterium]|nr:Ku protein [Rhodospirillales bacterium]